MLPSKIHFAAFGMIIALVVSGFFSGAGAQSTSHGQAKAAEIRASAASSTCGRRLEVAGGRCPTGDVPANAYPTNSTFGHKWRCDHGYREVEGRRCEKVVVPAHAYLKAAGDRWTCARGFRRDDGACVAIVLPTSRSTPTIRAGNASAGIARRIQRVFGSPFRRTPICRRATLAQVGNANADTMRSITPVSGSARPTMPMS